MKNVNTFLLISATLITTFLAKITFALSSFSLSFIAITACLFFVCLDRLLQRESLRAFNTVALGLMFGTLFGLALNSSFDALVSLIRPSSDFLDSNALIFSKSFLLTLSLYLGIALTKRCENSLYLSIPFIRFTPKSTKKKDFILTPSSLLDPRIIDLGSSGLLDHALILPRFILRHLQAAASASPTNLSPKKPLETIKKLEAIESLSLRISEVDPSHLETLEAKLDYLAEVLDANLITAEATSIEAHGSIRHINLHKLASAFKPLMEGGQNMEIKIQRAGKEPGQGVGYLDDGTMVVVNGGGEFLGEIIDVQVLSTKHTSSGRMVFCNAFDESDDDWD